MSDQPIPDSLAHLPPEWRTRLLEQSESLGIPLPELLEKPFSFFEAQKKQTELELANAQRFLAVAEALEHLMRMFPEADCVDTAMIAAGLTPTDYPREMEDYSDLDLARLRRDVNGVRAGHHDSGPPRS